LTALTSLSTADYSCVTPLVKAAMARLAPERVSLSVSSLRAYGLDTLKHTAFTQSWQLLADSDAVKVPGSVYPAAYLQGAIDEPLLLTRDYDDRVHCLANVCTHRGNLVCEGAGTERQLRCRYHGRRFELSGKFVAMPEFEGVVGFPSPTDSLPTVPLARWARFLFASLDPAASLDEFLSPMTDRIGWLPVSQFQPDPSRGREYVVRANWALYVDNYLEGFHIPYIHAALNDPGERPVEPCRFDDILGHRQQPGIEDDREEGRPWR
jgi:choline monooxygenase